MLTRHKVGKGKTKSGGKSCHRWVLFASLKSDLLPLFQCIQANIFILHCQTQDVIHTTLQVIMAGKR